MRYVGTVLLWAAVLAFAIRLYLYDPENGGFLPCPFRSITGLMCPGCGSQRALHDLLHFRLVEAFGHNALLVVALPVLAFQWLIGRFGGLSKPIAANNVVVMTWLLLVVGWWVARNV
jgi:hypothetical protein